jgi:hypothetical protein
MDTNGRDSRIHPGKKGGKVDQFIAALTIQPTIELAAKSVGIGSTTAYRWLKDPVIAERRREAAREASRHAQTRLREAMYQAVDRLRKLIEHADSEAVAVSACRAVLEFNCKIIELDDLQEQINDPESFEIRIPEVAKWRQSISIRFAGRSNG